MRRRKGNKRNKNGSRSRFRQVENTRQIFPEGTEWWTHFLFLQRIPFMAFTHRKLTCLPRTNNENDPIPISQIFFVILFLRFCSRWYCFCCCCYRGEEESEERKKGIHESCVSKKGNYFFYLSSSRILFLFPLSSYLFHSISFSLTFIYPVWR